MDTPAATPESTAGPRTPAWITLAAGVVAGGLAAGCGEAIYGAFRSELLPTPRLRPSEAEIARQAGAIVTSAWLTAAELGGLIGLALSAAGWWRRPAGRRALVGASLGLILAAGLGGSVALVAVPFYLMHQDPDGHDLVGPLLMHGAPWVAIGAGAGLMFGLGMGPGRWPVGLVGGVAGAALAAVASEVAGATIFTTARTDLPLARAATPRALAHLLMGLGVAAGTVLASRQVAPRGGQKLSALTTSPPLIEPSDQ